MYKTLEAVQAALAERLDDKQLKVRREENVKTGRVQEFTYVPWEATARQLDAIFGPFGWGEEITSTQFDTAHGIYIVTRRITGKALLAADGNPFERTVLITREAVGRAVAAGESARAHDTAIAAADSDSFSRAAKKLGDAFGLFLYDKDDPAHQLTSSAASAPARRATSGNGSADTTTSRTSSGGKEYRPTAGQLRFLHDLGWDDAAITKMSYREWKAKLDNREEAPTDDDAPGASAAGSAAEELTLEDALPF